MNTTDEIIYNVAFEDMLEQQLNVWIDAASDEQIIETWRNTPMGSPLFQGKVGKYYAKRFADALPRVAAKERE